jgi:phage gp45-like
VLRCGKSVLRIKPDAIEMVAPQIRVRAPGAGMSFSENGMELGAKKGGVIKAKELKFQSEATEITLNQTAKLEAPQIDLSTATPALASGAAGAEVPTKVELLDHAGKPIGYQHYVVLTSKGERIGGMVGKDGKDEIFLEDGDQIVFPERAKVEVK